MITSSYRKDKKKLSYPLLMQHKSGLFPVNIIPVANSILFLPVILVPVTNANNTDLILTIVLLSEFIEITL